MLRQPGGIDLHPCYTWLSLLIDSVLHVLMTANTEITLMVYSLPINKYPIVSSKITVSHCR
jgi:hypothetical protein